MHPFLRYSSTIGVSLMAIVFLVASAFVDPIEARAIVMAGLVLLIAAPVFAYLETQIARGYK